MSFWSGIKHALNSTLGTDKIQPLDEIMHKQWTIIASDDIYESFDDTTLEESFSGSDGKTEAEITDALFSVRMTKYGTIRIPYTIFVSRGNSSSYTTSSIIATILVNRNGASVASESYNSTTATVGNTYSGSFDIPVSPGDIITAELSMKARHNTSNSTTWTARVACRDLSICGTLKNSFYTKEETE